MGSMVRRSALRAAAALPLLLFGAPAFAHSGEGTAGGLLSGLLHPLTGPDHMLAMVAVGIWGAQLGMPAIWLLPVTFPLVMALGGVLGVLGVALPMPGVVIALSGVVLGAAVAARLRVPFLAAAVVVAVFAIFHGHAHGRALPGSPDPLAFGIGFVTATGLLHLCGIVIGLLVRWPVGERVVRGLGGAIAATALWLLVVSLGAA